MHWGGSVPLRSNCQEADRGLVRRHGRCVRTDLQGDQSLSPPTNRFLCTPGSVLACRGGKDAGLPQTIVVPLSAECAQPALAHGSEGLLLNHIHRCLLRCGKQYLERVPQECPNTTSTGAHEFVILVKLRAAIIEALNRVVVWLHVFCSEARE